MQSGKPGILIWLVIGVCLRRCRSLVFDGPKIVTYGEPCVGPSRQLPIRIEGPKPPVEEQKVPLSLNLKIVSDMCSMPRSLRLEYPIVIQAPCPTTTTEWSRREEMLNKDTLRGKTYAYNTYLPPVGDTVPFAPLKKYNFLIMVPVPVKENTSSPPTAKHVQRLKGLTTRIDRILVPACQVPQSRGC
ncbi:uncharacterized protein LOC117229554 [Megalopta genalis]|uniref:uncharacterized protein LOC117229554 n=1 Tax=Megalopta genalis TaxID=115081 RepID=UPI003FCFB980